MIWDTSPRQRLTSTTARERILPPEPPSPKTIAWDNPFPTFGPKKTERKKHTSLDKGVGNLDLGPSSPREARPQTSQGSRRREETRPNTSHSQRPQDPRGLTSPPLQHQGQMPLRKALPPDQRPAPAQQTHGGVPESNYPPEPAPPEQMGQTFSRSARGPPDEIAYGHMSPNRQALASAEWGQDVIPPDVHYNGGTQDYSDPNYNYQRPERPKVQTARSQPVVPTARTQGTSAAQPEGQGYGFPSGGPRTQPGSMHVQTSGRGFEQPQDDMPNFDAIPQSASEREELHVEGSQPEQPAYQKKAYQPPTAVQQPAAPSSQRGPQGAHENENVQSPIDQFQFDLPQSRAAPVHAGAGGYFPPRGVSRPDPQPRSASDNQRMPFSNGLSQGRPPPGQQMSVRPGTSNAPPGQGASYDQNGYAQDHTNGFDNGYEQQPAPGGYRGVQPSPSVGMNDVSRQYSHSPPQPSNPNAMQPLRPTTSTTGMSARPPPVRHYGDRNSADTFQQQHGRNPSNGALAGGEALPAHPVPFRPGLMNNDYPRAETPRADVPQLQDARPQQNRGPSGQPPKPAEPQVTTQELNELQQRVKANPQDYALGLKFAKKLVQAASVLSNENGRADQKTTAKNRERYILDAHKVVKKLVNSGYPDAMFYMADCHGQGLLGLPVDPKEAFNLYQSAAKLNHAASAYRVAVCCEIGQSEGGGTRQDPLKAIQWYKRAATLGDVPAMYKMGMILTKGLMAQTKNPREALTWLKRAADRADKENPHALHELALLYENAAPNDYIIRDEGYSLQLYTQAAELGYKYSQFRLGAVYEYGLLGQMIDPRASIAWYSAGAAQGEHQAELALSGWYLTGSDPILAQSDTEAYLWARKSANSGLSKAEYAMGYFIETGIGVAPNLEEAKRWYWKAAGKFDLL
jgi:TPR repeat protein